MVNKSFTMYTIASIYEEDYYFNFDSEQLEFNINEECLLPTEKMAQKYVDENLNDEHIVIKVEIESISKTGTWVYNINTDEVCKY
jgi:hypothetical protein